MTHCYSFPSTREKNDWFILSCIYLALISTVNCNLEAKLVTFKFHLISETYKFLVSLSPEKYNLEQ